MSCRTDQVVKKGLYQTHAVLKKKKQNIDVIKSNPKQMTVLSHIQSLQISSIAMLCRDPSLHYTQRWAETQYSPHSTSQLELVNNLKSFPQNSAICHTDRPGRTTQAQTQPLPYIFNIHTHIHTYIVHKYSKYI